MDKTKDKKVNSKPPAGPSAAKPSHSTSGTKGAGTDQQVANLQSQIEEFKRFIMEIKSLPDVTEIKPTFAQETLRVIAQFCDADEIQILLKDDAVLCEKMIKYLTRAVISLIDPIKKELQSGKNPDLYNNDEVRDKISAAFGALTNFFGVNSQTASQIGTYSELLEFMYPFWFHRIYDPFESLPYGVLVNLTLASPVCSHYVKSGFLKVKDLVDRSTQFPAGSPQLPAIMEVLQNLSQCQEGRVCFYDRENTLMEKVVLRLKPSYPNRVRIATAGILKNLSFEDDFHHYLVDDSLDLLAYAIRPLVGKGVYDEEELMNMPPLLYADLLDDTEMARDPNVVVRYTLLEFLYRLCSQRVIRESLRKQSVYSLLREYHKWEIDEVLLDMLERVVNLLIQTEEEIGADNLGLLVPKPE